MSDEEAAAFRLMDRQAQAVFLALEGMNPDRLEFDRWRVANGRDPEWHGVGLVEA